MADLLDEAGVQAMYGTSFVDIVMKGDDAIDAVMVENALGRQTVRGGIFIEGTGKSELVARAGAPFVRGGGPQPATADWDGVERPIPGGCLWIMRGIDFAKVAAYQKSADDPTLSRLIEQARSAGDIPEDLYRPWMSGDGVYGKYYIG
ncbi:MAG: FAD-dependent oxidoreductase, partial [Alphaproteobacteria bacterium]